MYGTMSRRRSPFLAAGLATAIAFLVGIQPHGQEKPHDPSRFILDMVYHNPGEGRHVRSAFLNPQRLKDWGYNGAAPHEYVQCAVTFDAFDKSTFPEGSSERQWVE